MKKGGGGREEVRKRGGEEKEDRSFLGERVSSSECNRREKARLNHLFGGKSADRGCRI